MAAVQITEYTDPGCPFAFSAEPIRWRLKWLYGDQLEWHLRMVVLSERVEDYAEKGLTAEILAGGNDRLAREHGMPMDTRVKPRLWATAPACRAVVAARMHAPGARVAAAAPAAGPELRGPVARRAVDDRRRGRGRRDRPCRSSTAWMDETDLAEDKAAARNPSPAALAQSHKLASWEGGMRYTCPSYEFGLSVPGFQPWAAYEVAFANVAPGLEKRDPPTDVVRTAALGRDALGLARKWPS